MCLEEDINLIEGGRKEDIEFKDIEVPEDEIVFEDDSVQGFFLHSAPIHSIIIDIERGVVFSGGEDKYVRIWDLESGEVMKEAIEMNETVAVLSLSRCKKWVASGSLGGEIHIISTETKEVLVTMEAPEGLEWLDWHPMEPLLAGGGDDGAVYIWRIPEGEVDEILWHSGGASSAGGFSPNGEILGLGFSDGTTKIKRKGGVEMETWKHADGRYGLNNITSIGFSSDDTIIIGDANGRIAVVSTRVRKVLHTLGGHSDSIERILVSGRHLACIGVDGRLSIWEKKGYTERVGISQDHAFTVAELGPKGTIVTGSMDGIVRVWDLNTGSLLKELHGHMDGVISLAISKEKIVSGSEDGTVLVYEYI